MTENVQIVTTVGKEAGSHPGIPPATLIAQVKNTVPFIFTDAEIKAPAHVQLLVNAEKILESEPLAFSTDLLTYYRLCLAAHHTTVASFIPTDVDIHIRFKLWKRFTREQTPAVSQLVAESSKWPCRELTTRGVVGPN